MTDFVKAALKEYSIRSFYKFVDLFWNTVETQPFETAPHIKVLCDALQARYLVYKTNVDNKYKGLSEDYKDILINCPPGSSKSRIVSIFFPAWVWLIDPRIKFITYSYSFKIAEDLSTKSLAVIQSDMYKDICGFKMESTASSYFRNEKGGSRFVTSTGGTVTGAHADIIIGDDPNSPQSIYSEASRVEATRFVSEILPSRKTSIRRSFIITVQQRLHVQDVSSVIIKNTKNLTHIVIPAINTEGESFCNRFPIEFLDNMKAQLGTIQFNAQYLQKTVEIDGGILKKDWIIEKELPLPDMNKLTYFLDAAYGMDKGDFTAIVGVRKESNNLILEWVNQNKKSFPELIRWMKEVLPSNARIYIEGKANGKSIIQTLKQETSFNILEMNPNKSKLERKQSVAPYFESGRIIINSNIQFKDTVIEQLIFDKTDHDDILDTIMYSIEKTLQNANGHYGLV